MKNISNNCVILFQYLSFSLRKKLCDLDICVIRLKPTGGLQSKIRSRKLPGGGGAGREEEGNISLKEIISKLINNVNNSALILLITTTCNMYRVSHTFHSISYSVK